FQIRAGYQEVGKKFGGFQALRLNNAGNKTLLDQLTALEAEKGVKRLGFGLSYDAGQRAKGKGQSEAALNLDWSQIQDEKGAITQQLAEFGSKNFRFRYAGRDVSETFAAFNGLREADKAQWAKEKGLKTSSLGFGLNFGGAKKGAPPGALD